MNYATFTCFFVQNARSETKVKGVLLRAEKTLTLTLALYSIHKCSFDPVEDHKSEKKQDYSKCYAV
jgi:hypothetical protein